MFDRTDEPDRIEDHEDALSILAARGDWDTAFAARVRVLRPSHKHIDWPTAAYLRSTGATALEAAETYCAPLLDRKRIASLIAELEIDSWRLA